MQCARVQGRGQAAMYLFSFRVAFTTCITCNNQAKLQQSNFPTQQLNKAVQGNLPNFPQRNVGIIVSCQENSSFTVFFANCCLVVFLAYSDSAYLATGGAFTGQDFDGPSGR